jgi:hypothetical protein
MRALRFQRVQAMAIKTPWETLVHAAYTLYEVAYGKPEWEVKQKPFRDLEEAAIEFAKSKGYTLYIDEGNDE